MLDTNEDEASHSAHIHSAKYPNLGTSLTLPHSHRRRTSGDIDCFRVLRDTFGKTDYKGKQKEIMEAGIQGADIFVSAPTGMGKSLCFQIPAVADPDAGITIVVSPLLALMKDQVSRLKDCHVPAIAWTSETNSIDREEIIHELCSGRPRYRLLYITPEKLMTKEITDMLKHLCKDAQLNRLVVDEAHCISEWGHDFREEYRMLGRFRDRFPDVPITALTASATPTVQQDIISSLKFSPKHLFSVVHPFNRENLFYEIRHLPFFEESKQFELVHDYIRRLSNRRGCSSSGIIYARTRATCDELSQYLRNHGVAARPYHRGIPGSRLDLTLKEWLDGSACEVVCCTVAFGLGIDKGDVRYVIHYDLPKSFEGYYQETGRAGRDGLPSKCIMYYSREDAVRVKHLVRKSRETRISRTGVEPSQRATSSIDELISFAECATTCRHILICRYFGEVIDERDETLQRAYCEGMCDVCKNPEKVKQRKMELSNEDAVVSRLPKLQNQPDSEPRGHENEARITRGHPAAQLPGPSVLRAERQPSRRVASDSVSRERYGSTSSAFEKDFSLWPRGRKSGVTDPFGRKQYDGPILMNGPIEGYGDPIGMAYPVVRRSRTMDHPNDQRSSESMPPIKKRKQNESPVMVVPCGKRVSSRATFKTPFRRGFDPLAPPVRVQPHPRVEETNDGDGNVDINEPCTASASELSDSDFEDVEFHAGCASVLSPEVEELFKALPGVDASYSEKIPLEERNKGLKDVVQALRKTFLEYGNRESLWEILGANGHHMNIAFSELERARAIIGCSLRLECNAMTYSARRERYGQNLRARVKAVYAYCRSPDDESELVQEVGKEMRRACEATKYI